MAVSAVEPYRQRREIRALMVALSVGLLVAGVVTGLLVLMNSVGTLNSNGRRFCLAIAAFPRLARRHAMVLDYLKRNQARFVAELCEYLRFPSVSAQPQHKKDLRACAEWLAQTLPPNRPRRARLPDRRPSHRHRQNAARLATADCGKRQSRGRISWSMAITTCNRRSRWTCGNRRRSSRASRAARFSPAARPTTRARTSRISRPSKPI